MSYKVLARRARPQTFANVVGQTATVNTLQRSLEQNRLHQAYLFTGTRGVGKTSIARILAKCMNCETQLSSEPCNACNSCKNITAGQFIDLIEIDAASHTKVEDIRTILENIPYRPNAARYKVYLIDEVHMLSNHSFNALLKTLEEPPEYVKFILCTTDPQKLPATILSRCLRFHLHNLSPEEIQGHLNKLLTSEAIKFNAAATLLLAEAADGSVRDSLSLLDQAIAYCDDEISIESISTMLGMSDEKIITKLMQAIFANEAEQALKIVAQMAEQGENFLTATESLMRNYHKIAIDHALSNDITAAKNELAHLCYEIATRGLNDLTLAPTERIGFEMMVMRLLAFQPSKHINSKPQQNNALKTSAATETKHTKIPTPIDPAGQNTSNVNWNIDFLQQIGLQGLSLELAKNCSIKKQQTNEVHLTLNPKYSSMLNEKQRQRIQDAIRKQANQDLALFIEIGEVNSNANNGMISNAQKQKKSEDLQIATSIQQDEDSQRIIQAFNAKVIAGSSLGQEAPNSKNITTGEQEDE